MTQTVKLKITKGKLTGQEFIFDQPGSYLVGRSPSCAVQIPKTQDGKISRKHFVLTFSSKGVKVRDLDSHNGTLVNGQYIASGDLFPGPDKIVPFDFPLKDGDKIAIGNTVLTISLIQTEEKPAETQPPPTDIVEETIPLTSEAKKVVEEVTAKVTSSEPIEEKIAAADQLEETPTTSIKRPAAPPVQAKPFQAAEDESETEVKQPAPLPIAPEKPFSGKKLSSSSIIPVSVEDTEGVKEQEETVVLEKMKPEPPPVATANKLKAGVPPAASKHAPIPNSLDKLKEQFKPPVPKKSEKPKSKPERKISQKEETSVMDSPKPEPPPLTATAPTTETSTLPADALAKQAPLQPAGMKSDLKVKKPEDPMKNLEEIAKEKITPPLSPDSLGAKKTSSLKVKTPGTGVNEDAAKNKDQNLAEIGSVKEEMGLSDLETIQVDRDEVIDDIDVDALVQQSKQKEGKRTTNFKIKGPN